MAFITAVRNRLVLDFSWKKVRCREYLRLPATREGRAEARRIKKQIEGEIVARTFDYAKWFPESAKRELFAPTREAAAAPTFAALAREWLENKKAWFAPATYYDRKRIIEGKLIPFLDDATAGSTSARLVSTIQFEDVERLVNAVKGHEGIHGKKLSNRRANIILDVLRQVLDRAVLRGWLTRNPARAVSKLREDRAPIDPFSFEEVKTLLEHGFRTPEDRRYFTVAFFTGLRPSEQIAAEWEAVDWISRPPLIGVLAAVSPRGGRGRTKTEASKRYVEMVPMVQHALREQRAASQRSSYIFPSRTGWAAEHHQRPRARVEARAPASGSSLPNDVPDPAHLCDARAPEQRADRVGLEAARPHERRDGDPALRKVHPEPHAAGRVGARKGNAGARLGIGRSACYV
jgi:integrase